MSKVLQRLLTFFIGIPLVVAIVFLPYFNYMALNIVVCIFSFLASSELYLIFEKNVKLLPKMMVVFLSVLLPVITYILFVFNISFYIVNFVYLFSILFLLSFSTISRKSFENFNTSTSLSLLIVTYTGWLSTFITRVYNFENGVYYIALFLIMVFMCDSIAWLFGMTLGKGNRGIIAVSPNKSIAGFIGAYTGCILVTILITRLFSSIFTLPLYKWIICAIITATASITGDLVESAFKRSGGVKDSGRLMPGRGGILDSIDSILFAAPVFYALLFILLGESVHP